MTQTPDAGEYKDPTTLTQHAPGWYEYPRGSRIQRYYDGLNWTDHAVPPDPPTARKQHLVAIWIAVVALLWIGAESHDSNCYTKVQLEALGSIGDEGTTSDVDGGCLILPWNEPSDD